MKSQTHVPAGRVGALYDMVVTIGFATPWTAALILRLLADLDESAGLPGSAMPDFETSHLLFVTLFGVVVTMWAVVRALWPVPFLIAADTVGRAAFALTFVWALAAGHSTVIVVFLLLEVFFLVTQGLGVRKALRMDRAATVLTVPEGFQHPGSGGGAVGVPTANKESHV